MTRFGFLVGLLAWLATILPAAAQSWPTRPVRLVVPYAPGGVMDLSARLVAKALGDSLGQQVVVDNRPGAGGMIGSDLVAKAAPDGYTLLIMDPAIAVNPSLQKGITFDVLKDLQVVSLVNASPLVLAVPAATPPRDVPGLIAFGKAREAPLTFGSAGIGTTPHMAGELFRLSTGLKMTHVAYKGMGPAVTDLVTGQIDLVFGSITAALPFIQDGKLRALATTGPQRSKALPDAPTVIEAGVPGFEVDLWVVLLAPAALPEPLLDRVNRELHTALATPALVEGFARVGAEPRGTTPAAGQGFLKAELEKWARVVKDANIRID